MESEKSALKRSFFREYFFYKLRGTLGISITSAVLGFISCILSGIFILMMLKSVEDTLKSDSEYWGSPNWEGLLVIVLSGLAGMAVLSVITPIVMFKSYRSRSSMDTLGCLPITYGERFRGDFLSGLSAIVAPFSAMAAIGGILLSAAQNYISRLCEEYPDVSSFLSGMNGIFELGVKLYLAALIIIVSAYSITTLVTSCCGKAASMALYSVITLPIIPAIVGVFGTFALNCAKGVWADTYVEEILSSLPPAGTLIYLINRIRSEYNSSDEISIFPSLAAAVFSLIFTAVMIAAAYLIGKRRKAERVGNGFAVNIMYHVLTLMLLLAVIGVYGTLNRVDGRDFTKILIGVVLTLVFYLILELVQYRNFKMIWKSLIRYACVAVVGFGFLIVGVKTECFGFGKNLPNQSDITEVRMTGYPFGQYYSDRGLRYRAEDAISAILSEHQRLLDNSDKIFTGYPQSILENEIHFTYKLKNGETVSRYYTISDTELCGDIAAKIKQQPVYEVDALGVLNRIDLSNVKMYFKPYSNYTHDLGTVQKDINSSKISELVEMLKYDLINYVDSDNNSDYLGLLDFCYLDDNGREQYDGWIIRRGYTKTIEFLKNPDNLIEESENPVDAKLEYYDVKYNPDYYTVESGTEEIPNESDYMISSAGVTFRSDSDSEYAKELMSYFSKESESNREGKTIRVLTFDENNYFVGETYFIPKDKESAALKALMNLMIEQTDSIQ